MNDDTAHLPARGILPALFFAAFTTAAALVLMGLQTLQTPTYWWHIALGELIAVWERIPGEQHFLFSVDPQTPWIYSNWLGSLALYHLHDWGGAELTLLIHNIFTAFSVGITAFYLSRRHESLSAVLLPSAALAIILALFTQPAPFSLVIPIFIAAGLYAHHLATGPDKYWPCIIFPVSVLLLVNVDFGAAAVLAWTGLLAAAALLWHARNEKGNRKKTIAAGAVAALSPLALLGFAYGPAHVPAAIAQEFSQFPAVLAAPFVVTFFVLGAALTTAETLEDLFRHRSKRRATAGLAASILVVTTIIAVLLQPGVPTRAVVLPGLYDEVRSEAPLAGVMRRDLPLRCAEELHRSGRELRLFHAERHAGFLLYHLLDPKRPAPILFHDHRRLVSPEIQDLIPLLRTEPIARGVFQRFDVNAAVVHRDDYPAVVDDLELSSDWVDLDEYLDDGFACFVRARRNRGAEPNHLR